jgi:hypothetical protein
MFYYIKNYENNYNLYCKNKYNLGVEIFENIIKNINISYELFKQIILKHNGVIINNGIKIDCFNDKFEDEYCYFENKNDANECIDELNILLKLLGD